MLTTERLVLRDLELGDWRALYDYWSDPEVRRHALHEVATPEDARELVRGFVENPLGLYRHPADRHFAVCAKGGTPPPMIGLCRLCVTDPDRRTAEIGFEMGRPHWGRGYATEAVRALLDYGFGEPGLRCVAGECFAANRGSVRVMEKAGMTRQEAPAWSRLLADALLLGRPRGVVRYAVRADQWKTV